MSLVEKLGLQFFEVCFCVGLVLLVYASIQKCVLYSFLILLILFFCFRIIQERGSEHVTAKGKWVLITGCDTGIGHNLAIRLSTLGYNVFATCLDVNSKGAQDLEQNGGERIHVLPLDVTSDESVSQCVKQVEANLPDKGRVVNVTSVRGLVAFPANSTYVISKFGAEGFSDCLRMEMKRFGVKVVIVEPGSFGGASALFDEANVERMRNANKVMVSSASDEVLGAYGRSYLDTMFEGAVRSCSTSYPDLDPVMASLTSAVASVSPQNRYLIDGSNQLVDIDCIMARLRPFVPVTLLDWLMLKVRGPPAVEAQPDFH